MNESILDYISKTYTVEMQEVLVKSFNLFERLNVETCEAFILNTLNTADDQDREFVSSTVINYVEGYLINLERAFGFKLHDSPTLTLEQRVDFIRGYVDLEDYIDHQVVIRICETDATDEEKLAEAIALTTEYGLDTLLSFITDVDEAALFTLSRMHQKETPAEEVENESELPEERADQILNIKAYELWLKEHHLQAGCFELIRQGYPVGAPFKLYWSKYKDVILSADRAKLSVEIVGLFLLSKEHWANPVLAFTQLSEELFDSINVISECNTAVRELMNGFVKFKAENKIA